MRGTRFWLSVGLLALFAIGTIAAGCGSRTTAADLDHHVRAGVAAATSG